MNNRNWAASLDEYININFCGDISDENKKNIGRALYNRLGPNSYCKKIKKLKCVDLLEAVNQVAHVLDADRRDVITIFYDKYPEHITQLQEAITKEQ